MCPVSLVSLGRPVPHSRYFRFLPDPVSFVLLLINRLETQRGLSWVGGLLTRFGSNSNEPVGTGDVSKACLVGWVSCAVCCALSLEGNWFVLI